VRVDVVKLTVRPLAPKLWPALEDLFGRSGACNGCWCMYRRFGPDYFRRPHEKNRRALCRIVGKGPPPGLLALDGERAVAWCQLTPRDDLAGLDRKRSFERVDALPVWSVSCFYVRRGCRRQGVMSALVAAALKAARRAHALALEAYPVDTGRPGGTANVFTGTVSAFRRAGCRTGACRIPARPVMRHDLKGITG
jgi:GNAT superfamily N-acetyltransferase